MAYIFMQQGNPESAKQALTSAITLDDLPKTALKNHPFLRQLVLISLEAAQYVIEDGYDPSELERGKYLIGRDEEGAIIVEFVEE